MKFACPHCTQKFEIADECAGHSMQCPKCQNPLTVPAPPAVPKRKPAPSQAARRGSGGFGKLLLTLLVLAGIGFGYAMVHFKESPQQVWKRLVHAVDGTTKPEPTPDPEPTLAETTSQPAPEPTPVEPAPAKPALVPKAKPAPTVTHEPTPTPAPAEPKDEPEVVLQEKPQPALRKFTPPQRKHSVRAVAFPTPRFRSPGVILNLKDLETLKANIQREPWKSGFEALANEGRSKLSYKMAGPLKEVKRSPNENLWPWRGDMIAVWNLSRMWYFTGDDAYAKKARDILLAWAKTHEEFGGRESMLDLGDYVVCFVGGADILRGTWPGWTRADTAAVKKYFNDVLMPASNPYGEHQFGAANKGALALASMGLMAIFNEDTAKLRTIVSQARVLPHIGLRSSNDIGLLGDSLRDQGHAHGHLISLAVLAEALWKQGIDIYSDYDNRLLAAGEYFARVNSLTPTPFLPFGTTDAYYTADRTNRGWGGGNVALNIIHGAYAVRMGLPDPFTARKCQTLPIDGGSFMFVKEVDRSKATPMLPPPIPATESITSGFQGTEIGDAEPTGNASYADGIWTIQGGGREIWKENDSCHFTYQTLTGNCAIVAKIESVGNTSPSAKAGVMMRTSLDEGSPRAWMALTGGGNLEQNMPNLAVYGGTNYGNKVLTQSLSSYWVKLERMGNIIAGYVSPDGTNWAATDVGRIDDPVPTKIHVGLVVCSAANGKLNSSTFSHVQITGGDGDAPVVTPAAPAALLAAPGDGVVPLRWQTSFGATNYTVKRATSRGGPYTPLVEGIPDSSFTDTTVTNGTTYHYVVTATNSAGTSADSPEDTATPMAPMWKVSLGGTATATVGNDGADNAFDSNSHTMWYAGGCHGVAALQYDFGPDHTPAITAYTITSPHFKPERDPRDWEFQGSEDGTHWITLDTRRDQTFPLRFYEVEYSLPKPAAYRYFRLNVTANNGDNDLHIADLKLLAAAPLPNAPVPSLRHWKTNDVTDRDRAVKHLNSVR